MKTSLVLMAALLAGSVAMAAQDTVMPETLERGAIVDRLSRQMNVVTTPGETPQEVAVSLPVEFEFGSDRLTPAARSMLSTVAAALNDEQLIPRTFHVEGHTDSVGSPDSNRTLSQRRADAVVAYLAAQGVAAGRLTAVGYGESRLLSGIPGQDGRNRRVKIVREL